MRLNIAGISQHWLCLKSPSFLSGLAVGLGDCIDMYTKYNKKFAFTCPLSGASPYSVIYTSADGTMAPAWSSCSGVVLAKLQRGFCVHWRTAFDELSHECVLLCSPFNVQRRPRTNPSGGDGCNRETMVPKAMFCTVILHKSSLQRSVRVCLRNVCTRTIKASGYLRTDSPSSWILV